MLAVPVFASLLSLASANPLAAFHSDSALGTKIIAKRQECTSMPVGAGPTVTPDTPSAFTSYSAFAAAATSAPTPQGYVNTYTNLLAKSSALGYMGVSNLASYDTNGCAAQCNEAFGCMAFNIAFERQPSLQPGPDCPNPASTTAITCTLWGGPVTSANAENTGQYQNNFQIVVAGSNGYVNSTIWDVDGYSHPKYLSDMAINAPPDCNGYNTAMQFESWGPNPLFDPTKCASLCNNTDCAFFETILLELNGETELYCATYNETWDASYATAPTVNLNGLAWNIAYSYAYDSQSVSGSCQGSSYTSLGCYQDYWNPRTLPYQPQNVGSPMTIQLCEAACSGYTYFGLEYASECYCGNIAPNVTADNCNMGCAGNAVQACGGGLALNVYEQAVESASPSSLPAATCPVTSTTTSIVTSISIQPASTNTVTVTSTSKITATLTTTAISTVTATSIVTAISSVTATSTTTTTSTLTTTAVSSTSTCSNLGVNWAVYNNNYGNIADGTYSQFDPTSYKTQTPSYQSITSYVGSTGFNPMVSTGSANTLYGTNYTLSSAQVTVNHHGYFHPTISGTYTVTQNYDDDVVFFWHGSNAYSGWTRANADFVHTQYSSGLGNSNPTFSLSMNAGQYYPFRIMWANAQGGGGFTLSVTGPNGVDILDGSTFYSAQVVQYSCDLVTAPVFAAFGKET